jgi:hypothetical protein
MERRVPRVPRIAASLFMGLLAACGEPREPRPIGGGQALAAAFAGEPARPQPVAGAVPSHPFLAGEGRAGMHADGHASDVHPGPGPLGREPRVRSRDGSRRPGGACPIHAVTRGGQIVALCADLFGFELQLLAPRSLELLARFALPGRPSTLEALLTLDPDKIMSDSSGAYFYLDEQDRVVIADARQNVRRIAVRAAAPGRFELVETDRWDLSAAVPHDCTSLSNLRPRGECDPVTGVLPDFAGRIWWVSRHGRVGTLDPATGTVHPLRLAGEEIQNGFAVAEDGVYVVSDHALYRFQADAEGQPEIGWREPYDRGSGRKVGSINQGSGTTPTLLGERWVTITDNADERIRLLVYRRAQGAAGPRLVCALPLFEPGASATDNSMIAWGRFILVENNHGYRSAISQRDWGAVTGGIVRVDVREDESGCDVVWASPERAPSVVAKLSAASGLAYYYTFETQADGENAWYLLAVDFATGRSAFRIRTGVGSGYDNNWGAITLAPDGTAYVGTFQGLVAVWDGR